MREKYKNQDEDDIIMSGCGIDLSPNPIILMAPIIALGVSIMAIYYSINNNRNDKNPVPQKVEQIECTSLKLKPQLVKEQYEY